MAADEGAMDEFVERRNGVERRRNAPPRNGLAILMAGFLTAVGLLLVYTGIRAEQVMSGATRMVMSRSRRFSMVRVDMMPGTAHANELSSGMNARPLRPTLAMSRSRMNAARAM